MNAPSVESGAPVAATEVEDEISLLDLAIVIAKHKRTILGVPAAVAVLSVIVTLLMTPIFTGTTKILPPQQSQSTASAMLSQLGGLLGGAAGGIAGIKNPNDLYVAMLKSRTVADRMIERFGLMALWEAERIGDARKTLEAVTKISAGKDGIIAIEVDDEDPKRAAAMANAYVEELVRLTNTLAVTEAAQRRLFFEQQLVQAKNNLARAEAAAKGALDRGGIAMVEEQGRSMVATTAQLRGQIAVKEVQIGALRSYATENNPEMVKAQQELASLRQQLAKLEGASGGSDTGVAGKEKGLGNLALLRDVKYFEVVFELLAKQYEIAKLDEAKDAALIQVLDAAVPPERKTKPKRAMIVILATLAAGFVAVLFAFVREAYARAQGDAANAARLADLRRHLAWRRR